MKRLLIIALLLSPAVAKAQGADAGPDKIYSPGKPVTIGTQAKDGKSCYYWEATPDDPGLINRTAAQIQVSPVVSTVYKLTVTSPDLSEQTTDNVTVNVFTINYFRYNSSFPWKVVKGFPVEYSATEIKGATNWKWELGNWKTTGGDAATGTMEWESDPLPESNDAFGETNGNVTVSCDGEDGTTFTASSGELKPPMKAQVFYMRHGQDNPEGLFPNWFYYWTKMIDKSTLRIASIQYVGALPGGEYAEVFPEARTVKIARIASEQNNVTSHTGLHCFIEVLTHENEHIVIYDEFWPNGYVESMDADGDEHPDSWERTVGAAYGYVVGVNDAIYPLPDTPIYKYQEVRCFQAERNAKYDAYDLKDWSYDPQGKYQGKQWKSTPSLNSLKK